MTCVEFPAATFHFNILEMSLFIEFIYDTMLYSVLPIS